MSTPDGAPLPPPGWYPDAYGLRWWDGTAWGPVAPVPPGGPMGPPRTEEEAGRTIAVLSQLWPLAGFVLSCFVFALPLVLYLVQKDQNRFARWHAGEALNSALTLVVVGGPILVASFVIGVSTLDDGRHGGVGEFPWGFFVGYGVGLLLGLVALALGIVGAIRASQGVWWRNPLAIPFVRAHRREAARPLR
jgi:uncharacterized Tic20 family protein